MKLDRGTGISGITRIVVGEVIQKSLYVASITTPVFDSRFKDDDRRNNV